MSGCTSGNKAVMVALESDREESAYRVFSCDDTNYLVFTSTRVNPTSENWNEFSPQMRMVTLDQDGVTQNTRTFPDVRLRNRNQVCRYGDGFLIAAEGWDARDSVRTELRDTERAQRLNAESREEMLEQEWWYDLGPSIHLLHVTENGDTLWSFDITGYLPNAIAMNPQGGLHLLGTRNVRTDSTRDHYFKNRWQYTTVPEARLWYFSADGEVQHTEVFEDFSGASVLGLRNSRCLVAGKTLHETHLENRSDPLTLTIIQAGLTEGIMNLHDTNLESFNPATITLLRDGSLLVTGNAQDEIRLLNLGIRGRQRWLRSVHGDGSESVHCVVQDMNGNIYLAGTIQHYLGSRPVPGTSIHMHHFRHEYFNAKLTAQGERTWLRTMRLEGRGAFNDMVLLENGFVFVGNRAELDDSGSQAVVVYANDQGILE